MIVGLTMAEEFVAVRRDKHIDINADAGIFFN